MLLIISLVLFTLIPYSNAPLNGFVYDDNTLIARNPAVHNISNTAKAFTQDYWWGTDVSPFNLYRPITIISYIINYSFSGDSPFSFHMVNILLHLVVVLLVYYFVSLLFGGAAIPYLTALIFAVHPIHTEAVTGIVGRAEILAALFLVSALCLFIHACRKGRSSLSAIALAFGSLIFYSLALLSKENAIVFPALIIVVSAFIESKRANRSSVRMHSILASRTAILSVLGSIFVSAIYMLVRWKVLGRYAFDTGVSVLDNPLVQANLFERALTASVLLLKYISLLLFPIHLSADYSAWQIPVSAIPPSAGGLIAIAVAIAFLFLLLMTYFKSRELFLPLSFFAVAYAIPSNLFMTIGTIFAERLMYLPSIGFCLLFAIVTTVIVSWLKKKLPYKNTPATVYIIVGIIVALFSMRIFVRNYDWKDNLTLFSATVKIAPKSARAHGNLGQALAESGRYAEALKEFHIFISLYPDVGKIHINMAEVYLKMGNREEAIREYREATRINPEYPYPYYHLGYLYDTLGRKEEAERNYKQAIKLKPGYSDALNNLGALYLDLGKYSEALSLFQRAYEVEPDSALPLRNQGEAYIKLTEYRKAEELIARYIEEESDDFKAYHLLAQALAGQERYDEAIAALKRSIELYDYSPDTHLLLSNLYQNVGKKKEAEEEYKIYKRSMLP